MIYKYIPLILLTIGFGCKKNDEVRTTQTISATQRTPAKTVVMVIAPRNFRDEELKVPYDYLRDNGFQVSVASTETTEASGMLGMKWKPNLLIKDLDPADYDALVLVGGIGAKIFWDDTTAHRIAKYFADNNKLLAAICLAPVTLARAGILKDKNATCFESAAPDLKNGGARYTGSPVVMSGRIITASGPEAAKEFAVAIANELK